ncbi:MAG: DHHA1 domain-containing protein, partial [Candidatus Atribacteria bacterium]|nr:DHHA1 domain-containing protein [Candidatus Atribacteria bacterium]
IRQAAVKEVLAHLQEMETGDAQIFLPHLFMANAPDIDYMKIIVDQLREQIPRGMGILGSRVQGKISGIVAGIHLPPTIDLNREIRTITKKMGGGGGGKANLCQFGGIPESQWDPFIQDLKNMIHIL